MENMCISIKEDAYQKRIKTEYDELIINILPESLHYTVLSEQGVKNILSTMRSTFLSEGPEFSIYVERSNALILARIDRKIEHKTVVTVYKIIDTGLYINRGLFNYKIEDTN